MLLEKEREKEIGKTFACTITGRRDRGRTTDDNDNNNEQAILKGAVPF